MLAAQQQHEPFQRRRRRFSGTGTPTETEKRDGIAREPQYFGEPDDAGYGGDNEDGIAQEDKSDDAAMQILARSFGEMHGPRDAGRSQASSNIESSAAPGTPSPLTSSRRSRAGQSQGGPDPAGPAAGILSAAGRPHGGHEEAVHHGPENGDAAVRSRRER